MKFSPRLEDIAPSMTLEINSCAKKMLKDGFDVISVAVGEPDFNTPEYIKKAAITAIEENFTKYTPVAGIPELRESVVHYYYKNYNAELASDSVIIGAGGKQCIFEFFQALLLPGDEVLIPVPYWVSYPPIVELGGGHPVYVRTNIEGNYKVTPSLLDNYKSDKSRFLIINNPCNPTGVVYSELELENIINWALKNNIYILSDEIYDQLVYKPARMYSAMSWFNKYPDSIGIVNGLSKSYAMTGWRVGFLCASTEIIKKMSVFQGHSMSNVCSIAQKAAYAALRGPDDFPEMMRETFSKRRNLAIDRIKTWPKISYVIPEGAFYIFLDVHAYYNEVIKNSQDFCMALLEKAYVAAVPGLAFGDDQCIRLSFAISDSVLNTALNRLGKFLDEL